jgi:hypothetical protein
VLRVARGSRQGESPGAAAEGCKLPCPETLYYWRWGGSKRANAGTRCSDHVPGLPPKEAATAPPP